MGRFLFPLLLALAVADTTSLVTAQNPPSETQVKLWKDMKRQLQGPNGKQYFELVLRDAQVPGATDGVEMLRGTVVLGKPTKRPTELVVAMSDDHTPEVTLTLRDARQNLVPLLRPIAPGVVLEFSGIPVSFTPNPFMLTFEVKAENGPSGANPRFLTKGPVKGK